MWVYVVDAIAVHRASFRYRCVWPALAASSDKRQFVITERPQSVELSDVVEGIIFCKTYDQAALELAWEARQRDIPVILDVADNIFVPDFHNGVGDLINLNNFRSLATLADYITVPTHALGQVVSRELNPLDAEIHVLPDCIESADNMQALLSTMERPVQPAADAVLSLSRHVSLLAPLNGETLPRPATENSSGRFRQMLHSLKQARHNDSQANSAAIRARLRTLRSRLSSSDSKASKPSRPQLRSNISAEERQARKTVIWFGNAGHAHKDQGIASLLSYAPALSRIDREVSIELLIISNNRPKYCEYIERLPIASRYAEWRPDTIHEHLRSADVMILPNPNDDFTRTKSANRVVMALSENTPVVADDFADLELLRDCVACDDSYLGLRRYLLEGRAEEDLALARPVLEQHYSMRASGEKYGSLLHRINARDPRRQPCLLFVFDLIQDFEVLRPILDHFSAGDKWRTKVLVSNWLMSQAGRLADYLDSAGITPIVLDREQILSDELPLLNSADAVLLASETNLGPHRIAHHVATSAAQQSIPAVTFQHGLENEGLSYFGENKGVRFASSRVLIWHPHTLNCAALPADTRRKCRPIGLFRHQHNALSGTDLREELPYSKVLAVFENLHWERYSDDYRRAFVGNVISLAENYPDCCLLLKPHPAGKWFSLSSEIPGTLPDNLLSIDPDDDFWRKVGASQLLSIADAVITTPSTIALDAALANVPVAVVAQELQNLKLYHGLKLLRSAQDWRRFIQQSVQSPEQLLQAQSHFLRASVCALNPFDQLEREILDLLGRDSLPQASAGEGAAA